jgi:hypothetical protein
VEAQKPPTYLLGERIRLHLEIVHDASLDRVWAVFRRRVSPGEEVPSRARGVLTGLPYVREWEGAKRISEVRCENVASRDHLGPGEYELEAVRGHPYGWPQDSFVEFEKHRPTSGFASLRNPSRSATRCCAGTSNRSRWGPVACRPRWGRETDGRPRAECSEDMRVLG